MRLTTRIALTVALVLAIAIVGTFALAGTLVVDDFKAVEEAQLRRDLQAVREAVAEDLAALSATARDWAHWDDTYAFVQGQDPGYESDNIAAATLQGYGLKFMAYLDAQGALVGGATLDEGVLSGPPAEVADADWQTGHLPSAEQSDRTGLQWLGDDLYLLSSWWVLPTDEEGPAAGYLTWGRLVDAAFMHELSEHSGAEISWSLRPPKAVDFAKTEHDWAHIEVAGTLEDLDGNPAVAISFVEDRPVLQQGIQSMRFFFLASLGLMAVALLVGVVVMWRGVAAPVGHLQAHMARIGAGDAAGPTPGVQRQDELGDLARGFDALVTQLDATIAQLRRSNEDLDEFARVASHDLKNPLATMQLNLALLARGSEGKQAEQVARLQKAADRMQHRLDGVLTYAMARAGTIEPVDVDMTQVAHSVKEDLQKVIEERSAEVRIERLPAVRGDPRQLAQLLENLVANGIKYGRPGVPPVVRVEGTEQGPWAEIQVIDNGRGFSMEDATGIFEPFTRLAGARDQAGAGVGLATCRRIVERHGGSIAASARPGEGASFTLRLPRAQP